jgi:hypothetical protein
MSDNTDRLREHPERRFDAEALRYDLKREAESLQAKSSTGGVAGHRQETLYKGSDINHGPTTIALFEFDAGATLPPHQAAGVVSIHVLAGRIAVAAAGEDLYRMVFGQPRQDDLVDYLVPHIDVEQFAQTADELRTDLTPPAV